MLDIDKAFSLLKRATYKQGFTLSSLKEVLISLRRVIRATDLHSKHLAKSTGLTAPQMLILQTLRDHDQVSNSELAHEISLSQATVTSIMDRLEKRNLVIRERSTQDKRKVLARLTDEGARMLKDAPLPLQEQFASQFNNLKDWEQSLLVAALQRVADMMDAQDLDASPILDIGLLDRQENIASGSSTPAPE